MKTKASLLFSLLLITAFVLTACGGNAATPTPAATEPPATAAPATEAPTATAAPVEPAGTLTIWADDTREVGS